MLKHEYSKKAQLTRFCIDESSMFENGLPPERRAGFAGRLERIAWASGPQGPGATVRHPQP